MAVLVVSIVVVGRVGVSVLMLLVSPPPSLQARAVKALLAHRLVSDDPQVFLRGGRVGWVGRGLEQGLGLQHPHPGPTCGHQSTKPCPTSRERRRVYGLGLHMRMMTMMMIGFSQVSPMSAGVSGEGLGFGVQALRLGHWGLHMP